MTNDKKRPMEEETAGRQPTNEEQRAVRQSAPQPTAESAAMELLTRERQPSQGMDESGAINGMEVLSRPIGREQVHEAMQTLREYKKGKAKLEERIVANEQWYKMRHWEQMRDKTQDVQPTSAWLFNCITQKHADMMDNFPAPTVLPREEGDRAEAKMLSSILPVILDQNGFENTYSDVADYKLKTGTGVYGVFWDKSLMNGLGDISIKQIDLLNLFWEPGITDIQDSRHFFHAELLDNDLLEETYPQLVGKLSTETGEIAKYMYDDSVDTSQKSVVVDWYYHRIKGGKKILHYCKFVGDEVLFATENERDPVVDEEGRVIKPPLSETGWYDHGMYPFVFDPLYRTEGTPTGFGIIDVGKDAQAYIDRGNQAIMKNMLANAAPRHFIQDSGEVNEEEYADLSKDFIHVGGSLGQDSILPVNGKPLSSIYVEVINNKIEELKETTGNRDVSNGGTTAGVTAASALAAMQEAGAKGSRDINKGSYRAVKKVYVMNLELMRQFYDLPRCFRIIGENGAEEFVSYSNSGIVPQYQGMQMGVDMGYRLPLFDIEVAAQKASPYSKLSQNELALQFLNAGFFAPQMADQALACIEMMDFDRKDFVAQRIAKNGTMYQQLMMLQQQMMQLGAMVDGQRGGNEVTRSLAMQFGMEVPAPSGGSPAAGARDAEALGGDRASSEPSNTKKARQRVADSTAPN